MKTQPLPWKEQNQRRCGAVLLVLLLMGFLALVGRLGYINTALKPRLLAHAEKQYVGNATLAARRGTIFDDKGRVVATSRRMWDVFIDPLRAQNLDATVNALAARINEPPETILEQIERRPLSRYVVVANTVDDVTAEAVRAMDDRAVGLSGRHVRHYPLGESLCHVIGFVGRDGNGLGGMELSFDEHLAGLDGRRATIRDGRRRALWRCGESSVPPTDGGHLVLTIDAEIQRVVEQELASAVQDFRAKTGMALVLSPKTGDVLAMASVPFFNPNRASQAEPDARRNRTVTDPTEPGSTIKPLIMSAALAGGFVTKHERINCHMGVHRFGKRVIKDVSPQGMADIKSIIIKSSNIGMAQIGERMGAQVLYEAVRGFGLGTPTGIECPGESAGVVHPLPAWGKMTTQSVSFGYEIGVTPLQLITAYLALINEGDRIKPRLVRGLLDRDGEIAAWSEGPEMLGRAVPADIANYIRDELLVAVISEGSAASSMPERYRVLGKTGTAKLTDPGKEGYVSGWYQSTFIGAAPAADPEIVVLVMIRRPDPAIGYYGATVAAPSAGRMIDQILAYLEVPPDRHVEFAGM